MAKPKEDPADKAARLRERRVSELERAAAAQKQAAGLSSDLRAVYGLRSMSLFGMPGIAGKEPRPSFPIAPSLPSMFPRQ